jgi:hypothetical protein
VTLGVSGSTVTQVTSGLADGDQVLLADLSQPLPTAGTTNGRGGLGGAGLTGSGGAFRGSGGGAGGGGAGAGGGGVVSVPKAGGGG